MIDVHVTIPKRGNTISYGPGKHEYCKLCGSQIHFVKTRKGKQMPCDMALLRGDGKRTLIDHAGVTHRKASNEVFGYEPHFGTCPELRRIREHSKHKEGQHV